MTIKEKIEKLESDLQQIIQEHNQLIDRKNVLTNAAIEIQGALKVLKELDVDQPTLKIPVLDIKMPIPETAVVVTAVTTAVVAVATTSITQSLFEPIKKKVQKQLQAKVNKWKEKRKKDSSPKSKME